MGLQGLFEPDTVAVFCDSGSDSDQGQLLVSNIQHGSFHGEITAVDSHAKEICGITCIKDPRDYHRKIDLAIMSGPSKDLERHVDRAIMAGAKTVIVIPKLVDEDKDLTNSIEGTCKSRSVRLLGPSSLGIINLNHGLNASITDTLPPPGHVALLSESTSMTLAVLERMKDAGIGISKAIGLGAKSDLDELDLFKELTEDNNTKLVVACLESISSGKDFLKRAERLANAKPVIVLKAGTTHAGEKAALEHSGRVSASMAYGAAFRRAGIIQATSFNSLIDLICAFDTQPLPSSDKVLVVADDGAVAVLAADALEQSSMQFAGFASTEASDNNQGVSERTRRISEKDISGALNRTMMDKDTGAAILILSPQTPGSDQRSVQVAQDMAPKDMINKPVFVTLLGRQEHARDAFMKRSIPVFSSPERAVAALEAMRTYQRWRSKPPRIVTRFRVNRRRVERILRRHERSGYKWVQDYMARQILSSYDFKVPQSQLVDDVEMAVEVAKRMGYPVTLSIVSFQILDKTAMGLTRRDLSNPDSVRDAYDLIMLHLRRQAPDAQIEGVLVESHVELRHGVVIGMVRDMQFGPLLMFGHGSTGTRIMGNATFHLAPITADEARDMLMQTPAWKQLQERWIGVDSTYAMDAVVGGLQKISQLATDFPAIEELEINPFSFDSEGTPPVAIHARMVLTGEQNHD